MDNNNDEDMDSLFDGMVLFTPQAVVDSDASSHPEASPSVRDVTSEALPSLKSASSEPLDENLFSDLTVITPSYVSANDTKMHVPADRSPVVASVMLNTETGGATAGPFLRRSSIKKKRAGLRIGYGRNSQLADELDPPPNLPESLPAAESSLSVPTHPYKNDLNVEGDKPERSFVCSHTSQHELHDSSSTQQEPECREEESHTKQADKENLTGDEKLASTSHEAEESFIIQKKQKQDNGPCNTVGEKYEQIKDQINDKLRYVQEHVSLISVEKKESRRRRRQAAENVELASGRYKEIEKKLEEASEMEDFEMADRLSESLAAAEKEKVDLSVVLRDAEAYCDAIDSKMEEALEHQIIAEEECVSLLQHFSEDALSNANLVLETVEVNSQREMDRWFMSVEALESKKLEIEIESQLVKDARSAVNGSVEHLVEDDIKEKEALYEKKKSLTQELEELLRLVREKEAEIAENDSNIAAVQKRIAEVSSDFKDVYTRIDADLGRLQIVLSEMESESEALSKRKEDIDNLLSRGRSQAEELRKLSTSSTDEASMYEENLRLRKAIATSVRKAREEKIRLAKAEEKILADTQMLKQDISVARVSLQALSSKKSSIQQESASLKQRMIFIDKRVPELEAEKKVAAAARNFKEAARIAGDAKSLTAEKESQQAKLEESKLELVKIDEEINKTSQKLQELEELVSSKEREIAVTRFQRLRLISAAASTERSAALELGDLEEAKVLSAEAEAAEFEAKELQLVHSISEDELGDLSDCVSPMMLSSNVDKKQLEKSVAECNEPSS